MKHGLIVIANLALGGLSCASSPHGPPVTNSRDGDTVKIDTVAPVQTRKKQTQEVIVLDSVGRPASGLLVAPSAAGIDLDDPALVARINTDARISDANGSVTFEQDGAFTATVLTASSFGIAAVAVPPASPTILTLDSRCHEFNGVVNDQSAPEGSASVNFVRVYPFVPEDTAPYIAKLDAHHRFHGCLPVGRYFVDTTLEAVGGGTLFDLPLQAPLEFIGTTPAAAKLSAPDFSGASRGLDTQEFARQLPSGVRLVAMGESTHGAADYTAERTELSLALAKQRRLRYVLLEAGFGESLAIDRYVRGEAVDLRTAIAGLRFWMWDTEDFVAAMQRIRALNMTRRPSDRIGVLGIDIQFASGVANYFLEDKKLTTTADERRALLNAKALDPATGQQLEARDKDALMALARRRLASRRDHGREALAAIALSSYLHLYEAKMPLELDVARDRSMAAMANRIVAIEPGVSVIWAHMLHVTKRLGVGHDTMGSILAEQLGNRYFAVAMLSKRGDARAWDAEAKVGVISHTLDEAPEYSIERVLGAAGNTPSYVMFANLPLEVRTWLRALRYVRVFGAVYPEETHGWELLDMEAGFDGVVVFDTISSSRPTPTGERRAAPADENQ